MRPSSEIFGRAAAEIAEQLARAAQRENDTARWLTTTKRPGQEPEWTFSAGLYNGVAGIAAFLLEAWRVLGDERYRELALQGLRWSERTIAQKSDYSFYAGRLGVAWVMLRAYELTGDAAWAECALQLARGYERFAGRMGVDDLLGGSAGVALGYLHLHAATGEAWTAAAAEQFLNGLLRNARWTPHGVTWLWERENIRGLCGMAHGNAGIAFVLLEASRYFSRPGLAKLAREAMRYESAFFDPELRSWPDFRKLIRYDDELFAQQYGHESEDFFVVPGQFEGWCHGAPGIGLSRAHAVEALGPEWRDDLRRALERTRAANEKNSLLTLCHGVCGNASLFVEAARVLDEPEWFALAEDLGRQVVELKARFGRFPSVHPKYPDREDLSLMLGNAGIGFFLLQLADDLPNPLLPRVKNGHAAAEASWEEGELAHILVSSLMPRTMALVGGSDPFFDVWRERDEALAHVAAKANEGEGGSALAALERSKIRLYDEWPSFALARFQKWRVSRDAASWSSSADLDDVPFRLAPYARIWRDSEASHLLRVDGATVVDEPLTPLAETVLACFEEPGTMSDAVRVVAEEFDSTDSAHAVRAAVEQQVRAALAAAVLECAAGRPFGDPPR